MEAGNSGRGIAWALIGLLACGFCYSFGFEAGSLRASNDVNLRIDSTNRSLLELMNDSAGQRAGRSAIEPETADVIADGLTG